MERIRRDRAEIRARLVPGSVFRTDSGGLGIVRERADSDADALLDVDYVLAGTRYAVRRVRSVRLHCVAQRFAGFASLADYKRALFEARSRVAERISLDSERPISYAPLYAFGERRA
jgi:hypothetical protein